MACFGPILHKYAIPQWYHSTLQGDTETGTTGIPARIWQDVGRKGRKSEHPVKSKTSATLDLGHQSHLRSQKQP